MPSWIDNRPRSALGRAAAASMLAFCLTFAADAPADEPPGMQHPGMQQPRSEPQAPKQPDSSKAPEGNQTPERRQRIRDEGAEDELRERSRLLLAVAIRSSTGPA